MKKDSKRSIKFAYSFTYWSNGRLF